MEKEYDKVYNYLLALQKEDGKIEADVLAFVKEMSEKDFKEVFESEQKKFGIIKGFEVVFLGYSYYKKEKDVVFSFGKIEIEKGEDDGERKENTIQNSVEQSE